MTSLVQDLPPILALVLAMWGISLWRKDASLMDVAWGPGFVLVALWHLVSQGTQGVSARQCLMLALLLLWAARLAWHIASRHGGVEDLRYRRWREQHGPTWWWRSLFQVFLLQGVVMWLVARPVAAVCGLQASPLGWLDLPATTLALAGLLWEGVADAQLATHRSLRPGTLLTTGLWAWHRHPNYFGEALFWWGLGLMGTAAGKPFSLASALIMSLLLRFASGVPLVERSLSIKAGWADYARRVNAFWPRPPRSGGGV